MSGLKIVPWAPRSHVCASIQNGGDLLTWALFTHDFYRLLPLIHCINIYPVGLHSLVQVLLSPGELFQLDPSTINMVVFVRTDMITGQLLQRSKSS